jgi:mono/diheme cytochrome c family protein
MRKSGSIAMAAAILALPWPLAQATNAAAQDFGDARQGQAYAAKICAECHAVRAGEAVSPRPRLATFTTIANTPGVTGTALSAWLQTSHKEMPNLIIPPQDRDNLIAYILSLKVR